jgi:hypothetical protein
MARAGTLHVYLTEIFLVFLVYFRKKHKKSEPKQTCLLVLPTQTSLLVCFCSTIMHFVCLIQILQIILYVYAPGTNIKHAQDNCLNNLSISLDAV